MSGLPISGGLMKKEERYKIAFREMEIRLKNGGDLIADLGNVAAILRKHHKFFWVGFYLLRQNQLVLGPFQGSPACVFLPIGRGVCGTCAEKKQSIIIPDVHQFNGHIGCDPNSKSEIVIPLFSLQNKLKGVLDVDSEQLNHFDIVDQVNLEEVGKRLKPIWG